MNLIGISGKKQSGKDSVCEFIKKTLEPHRVVRLAFADEVKFEVANACGVSIEYIERNKKHFRLILQGWGTDFKRDLVDKDYWIKKMGVKILRLPDSIHTTVISDVRFLNEANLIKTCGGILVRVNRDSVQSDEHISEVELDNYPNFDYVIENDLGLESLETKTKTMIEKVLQNVHPA